MNVIKPIIHETIWGGNRLAGYCGSESSCIGHLYSAIDTPEMVSVFSAGPLTGKTVHDWFLKNREKYGLGKHERMPLILALLDASSDLSIQVHPDDTMAAELTGSPSGKNETFIVLQTPHSGLMYDGCNSASPGELAEAIENGKLDEQLNSTPCEAGDYIYIEGGTLHAATAGSLNFEIEENGGQTYRFYDYDRVDSNGNKRPLQLEEALKCLDVSKKTHKRQLGKDWIVERAYASKITEDPIIVNDDPEMFMFAVPLEGKITIDNLGQDILPGTAVLLEPGELLPNDGARCILVKPRIRS